MASSSPSTLNPQQVNAFIEPAIHVLERMAGIHARVGQSRRQGDPVQPAAVVVMIGIRGDMTGTILFRFPRDLACRLVSNLTKDERSIDEIDARVKDALGELANIIAGNATGNLARLGIHAVPTPPVIVMGADIKLVFPDIPQLLVVPLITQLGETEMDVAFAVQLPRNGS
ncbi:MAG: chemotaxis protein CheX [Nitrospirae bacterium]|nr:chemotaxis protein CheX [Nitrospirota bacterium]